MLRPIRHTVLFLLVGILIFTPYFGAPSVSAQATSQAVDELQSQVKTKQQAINALNGVINKYKARIQEQASAELSLQNELSLLENRVRERELAIERTKNEIDVATLEISRLDQQIALEQQKLDQRKKALGSIIGEMQDAQSVSLLESFIAQPSLSEFFARLEQLDLVNRDLANAVEDIKGIQSGLKDKKTEVEKYRTDLGNQVEQLEQEQSDLERQRSAKDALIAETSQQEAEFQKILYELRQQQQEEANAAASLEQKLKQKLDAIDGALARGDVLLNWPVSHFRVTATFHDPSYPFRHLFEHPGIDLAVPVGTPVRAAAGGYVAFTRLGKQYGQYIMLIHSGGIASIYAHLSKFNVKPDTYVERGDIIGYSGGAAGAYGSGLSTGAHLHFEVRQDGIPTNPEQFLPSR